MNKEPNTVNLSLQVIPLNTTKAYSIIDRAIAVIQNSGLKYEVQPFATLMEGKLDQLLEMVKEAARAAMDAGSEELLLNIQVHLKRNEDVFLEEKTRKFR